MGEEDISPSSPRSIATGLFLTISLLLYGPNKVAAHCLQNRSQARPLVRRASALIIKSCDSFVKPNTTSDRMGGPHCTQPER